MSYTKEDLLKARGLDVLSYLRQHEPQELIHVAGNTYCPRKHDSLKISNGKWYWFSRGIGGKSALDYLIKVKGIPFMQAVEMILGRAASEPPVFYARDKPQETDLVGKKEPPEEKAPEKKLLLPELREDYPFRAVHYLEERGIDRDILNYCIQHKLLFETKQYHNAVFVGYDKGGVMRYAAMRATKGPFKGEATGSDKHFSFFIAPDPGSSRVHVFESAIDLLSYATLEHRAGRDWRGDALLSLAGVFQRKREKVLPVALKQFLEDHPSVKTVCLHLDNDTVGRSAAQGIMEALADKPYQVIDEPPTHGKDVNDQLRWELQINEKEYER